MGTDEARDGGGRYVVLINGEGQHSLWSAAHSVPDGWDIVFTEGDRDECMSYIEQNWIDMRPKSLVDSLASEEGSA